MKIIKILVVVVAHQLLGFFWYSPALFSNSWLAAQGKTMSDLDPKNPAPYIVAIFSTVIFTIVLNCLINRMKISTFLEGTKLGLWAWLGFFLPAILTHYVFLGFPFALAAIDSGYNLAGAILAGGILGGWRDQAPSFKTLSI